MLQAIAPDTWKTLQPVSHKKVTVPVGFVTDGASIPRILWPVFGHPFSYYNQVAAIVHDYCYAKHNVSRKVADQYFYELLIERGKRKSAAYSMWLGVRAFGWLAW